ncbi:MAG: hypothetical protein JJ866_12685 [Roseibium sp.]|uniref:hypothetical protein n=1 Tax=Roseibium sp. TaxID=1936156 RepID=UPI001B0338B9|nr:hypothetical protein [Roseibium sp.]MBO6892791.1 hypothetical protein [Roseibium sp.]MBO6928490.1 hypothetical protein [Roseibium sp.]
MRELHLCRNVEAPLPMLWRSWDRFGDIDRFHPKVMASRLTRGSARTGLGAERWCLFGAGGPCLKERIIAYQYEEYMVIHVVDGRGLLEDARITLDFVALSTGQSRLAFRFELSGRKGMLFRVLSSYALKRLRMEFDGLLNANAGYVERCACGAAQGVPGTA